MADPILLKESKWSKIEVKVLSILSLQLLRYKNVRITRE